MLAAIRKRFLLKVVLTAVTVVGLTPATGYADHEPGHVVIVDGTQGGVTITITIPGSQGNPDGSYGTDEGVNLNPCRYVEAGDDIHPSTYVKFGDEWPTEEQYEDPGVIWYHKVCDNNEFWILGVTWVLVGEPPPPGLPPPPPPATLAALAVKYMPIPTPQTRTNPTASGVVNLSTWLWLDNASWTVPPGRLSLRGVTVTVIATPKYVDWDTGAGTKRCNGQGRAYDTSAPPEGQSTYCSWTYTASSAGQPGENYHGTATSVWGIHWISSGGPTGPQQGDLPDMALTTPFEYRVEEIQSVVTK